jgi:hypothetical protein
MGDAGGVGVAPDRRLNGAAVIVSQNDDQRDMEVHRGIFNAAESDFIDNISGRSDHKKIPKALIKNDFRRHAGIAAAHDDSKGILSAVHQFVPYVFADIYFSRFSGNEPVVSSTIFFLPP